MRATAMDEFGNEIREVVFNWTAQDSAGGTIGRQGLFTAGTRAGFYANSVKVVATQGNTMRETVLDVSVSPGPFSSLVLNRPEVTLNIGAMQSFTLRIFDEFGNEIFDVLTSWSIAAGAGTVDASGVVTAGTRAGAFPDAVRVDAVKGTERATMVAGVTIMPDPLATIDVQPFSPVMRSGGSVQLTATGLDRYGNEIPDLEFLWEGAEGLVVDGAGNVTTGGPLTPPPGLVGWWAGEGGGQNSAGGNAGALSGGVGFTSGIVGQAVSFDGEDDRVVVPATDNLNITGDVTVHLWARLTVLGTGRVGLLVSKGAGLIGDVVQPRVFMLLFSRNDVIRASFRMADEPTTRLFGLTVTDTEFHHYAYVRSGDFHKLFFDGEPVAGAPFTGTPGDTSGLPLVIGANRSDNDPTGYNAHFEGVIDEVKVFDRALSDTEIRDAFDLAGPEGTFEVTVRASYQNSAQSTSVTVTVQRLPDLVPSISAPATARAGEEIGAQVFVTVENQGIALARGTDRGDSIDEGGGYMVEIVLSTDTIVPPGSAIAAPIVFREDALVVGGRETVT